MTLWNDTCRYYVYRHVRRDTNVVFYIGVGTKRICKERNRAKVYYRMYQKDNRNRHWQNVVAITKYSRDVLNDCKSKEEAHSLERNYIIEYGRCDLGTGTLVNLTDGGEGLGGCSAETKAKSIETRIRSGSLIRNRERLKQYRIPKGEKRFDNNKACFVYDVRTDQLLAQYRGSVDCGPAYGMAQSRASFLCRNNRIYNGMLFTYIIKNGTH